MSSIGFWRATALVIGNVVGAGIYFLPVSLAPFGAISIGGWIVTALGSIFLALMFAQLARTNSRAGGPYAYSRAAFGDAVGFQMAWCYWASNWISNGALAIACVSYLSVFFPELNSNRALACSTAISLVWLATLINVRGVKQTSTIQVILTVLKLSPLILVGLVGLFFMKSSNFSPINQSSESTLSAINSTAMLTLWAFIGLESATIPSQHVYNPTKTIPRATIFGTVLCAVIYIAVTMSVIGLMGSATLATSSAPIADAAKMLFGDWAGSLAAIGAFISAFGCLLGWVLLQGQMPYAAAADGLFPQIFAKVSKNNVPVTGVVLSSILITGVMLMNYIDSLSKQFTAMVTLSTFIMLVPYAFSGLANIVQLIKNRQQKAIFGSLFITCCALAFTVWLIVGAGSESILLGLFFMGLGLPVYLIMKIGYGVSPLAKRQGI